MAQTTYLILVRISPPSLVTREFHNVVEYAQTLSFHSPVIYRELHTLYKTATTPERCSTQLPLAISISKSIAFSIFLSIPSSAFQSSPDSNTHHVAGLAFHQNGQGLCRIR
jgi:hypothetical protein